MGIASRSKSVAPDPSVGADQALLGQWYDGRPRMHGGDHLPPRPGRARRIDRRWAGIGSGTFVLALLLLAATTALPVPAGRVGVEGGDPNSVQAPAFAAVPAVTPEAAGELGEAVAAATGGLSAAAGPDPSPAGAPVATTPGRYVVEPGDTLQAIAERHGLQPITLASANDLADPDLVEPGRELLIPATDGLVHIVQVGETIRAIAER